MISSPRSPVLPARSEGSGGGGDTGGDTAGGGGGPRQPRLLSAPLLRQALHAAAASRVQSGLEDIVITVTEVADGVREEQQQEEEEREESTDTEAEATSDMSSRIAAIRSRTASREATPSPSRAVSRVPSRDELNREPIIINPVQVALPNHPLEISQSSTSLALPSRRRSDPIPHHWQGSSSNLTSTDSTLSTENSPDSGQATDSPLTGPATSMGYTLPSDDTTPCLYRMPIIGYEVLESRARFTVFKIQVCHQPSGDHWFVFRRYTDFVRLNRLLKREFPGVRFALPPKRWFGDNFDPIFLEDRQLGLQAFINNIIGHTVIRAQKCVRDFFCLDNPLGPHDTLEESRALCQSLEETVSDLQEQLKEKDGELTVLRTQINFLMVQQQTLVKALRLECDLKSPVPPERGSSHDLNLALLNICERTLDGGLKNIGLRSPERNGASGNSQDTSQSQSKRLDSIESPLRRTLEKAFLPRSCSHNTLSPTYNSTISVNGARVAKPLFLMEGEGGASR